jgi:DNA-binding transcriptional LysR family regulator
MERIEIREIECFVAVAESLSFSKAARRLNMTQPPLSRQIKKLEDKLGVDLFLRNSHRVELTPEGRVFLEEGVSLLRHTDRIPDSLRLARSGRVEIFNVAFLGALLDEEIVSVLRKFRTRMPGCQVRAHEVTLDSVASHLRNREMDGVFIASAPDIVDEDLAFLPWRVPKYKVLMASGHRLAERSELRLKDLAEEPWIMISRKSAPFFRERFVDACTAQGFQPRIIHESDRLPAILAMAALGEGIGLLSHSNLVLSLPHLILRPLVGGIPKIEHAFAYRKDDESPALAAFLKLLRAEKRARR